MKLLRYQIQQIVNHDMKKLTWLERDYCSYISFTYETETNSPFRKRQDNFPVFALFPLSFLLTRPPAVVAAAAAAAVAAAAAAAATRFRFLCAPNYHV